MNAYSCTKWYIPIIRKNNIQFTNRMTHSMHEHIMGYKFIQRTYFQVPVRYIIFIGLQCLFDVNHPPTSQTMSERKIVYPLNKTYFCTFSKHWMLSYITAKVQPTSPDILMYEISKVVTDCQNRQKRCAEGPVVPFLLNCCRTHVLSSRRENQG